MLRRIISVLCSAILTIVSVLVLPTQQALAALSLQSTTLVSAATNGNAGNDWSTNPRMTPDGRYVVFNSKATNLTSDQLTPGINRVFLYDSQLQTMQAVQGVIDGQLTYLENVTPTDISDNGRYILYNPGNASGVYLLDRQDNDTTLISGTYQGAITFPGAMSGDANIIAFRALAVGVDQSGQPLNYDEGIIYNRANNTYTRVHERDLIDSISRNGQYAFGIVHDYNTDTNTKFWYNIATGESTQILPNLPDIDGQLSPDGNWILYTGPSQNPTGTSAWYATNLATNQTLVVCSKNARSGFASMSADDRYVSYIAIGASPKELWVADLQTGTNLRIAGSGDFFTASQLSADGSKLSYQLPDSTLATTNRHVYVAHISLPDTTAPVVTAVPERQPDVGTWYNHDVSVNWTATDPQPSSGTPTIPSPILANQEGTHTYTSDPSCDPAGNCATGSIEVSLDKSAPTLGVFNWGNSNPKPLTASATLAVSAIDSTSGLNSAEYFVGQIDPGQGNGMAMTLANEQINASGAVTSADLTATLGTSLAAGAYDINVRTKDNAGNWSAVATGTLVVFDAMGPTDFTAGKQVVPTYGSDILPGLLNNNQKDKANLSFDVFFTSAGTVDPGSWLTLDYATGNGCSPQHPEHCDSIANFTTATIAPNSITSFALSGTNSSAGSFQGIGTLTINGVASNNPFKVQGIDGARTNPTTSDEVTLLIYAPDANLNSAAPLYRIFIKVSGNWLKIT